MGLLIYQPRPGRSGTTNDGTWPDDFFPIRIYHILLLILINRLEYDSKLSLKFYHQRKPIEGNTIIIIYIIFY